MHAVVWNPKSRGGKLKKSWPDIRVALERELGSFTELATEHVGHATELTREALKDGHETIVVVGGDGTINEVVNGFFVGENPINKDAVLGILPYGTGGDFMKTLKLPTQLEQATQVIKRAKTETIDLGIIRYTSHDSKWVSRFFINIASCGMSGVVDRLINQSGKKFGSLSFLSSSLKASLIYDNKKIRVVFDGDDEHPADVIINTFAVANGQYFGGGMHIAPEAALDDGVFDVVAIGDVSVPGLMALSRRIYKGSHLDHSKVSHRRAKKVEVKPLSGKVELDIDGEAPGVLPAEFEIVPKALRLIMHTA